MAVSAPKQLSDGFTTLLGGVDESRQPLLLREDQVSRAINLTFRGGMAKTRPPFMKRNLLFSRPEYGLWFIDHKKQGEFRYDDFQGMEKIVVSIGGRIFLISPTEQFLVTDITPKKYTSVLKPFTTDALNPVSVTLSDASEVFLGYPIYIGGKEYTVTAKSGNVITVTNIEEDGGVAVAVGTMVEYFDPNSPDLPTAWFEQAEEFLIIQDDQSGPIIFNGATSRRAITGEIPSGSAMAYGNGRIWVAINRGREFVAGDIAGGPTGVLGFTENTYLSGGGSFRIPSNAGRIRAMKFVANLDTSLGQGPLQILTDRAIFSVNAPTSREAWASVTNPIQTVSLINFGATGQASTVLVNGDLFFRSNDGIRSFVIARRDFGMWGNTPISREMSKTLDSDTPELLRYCCATLFDNRLLMTATPQPGENGVRHKCIIALDFDLISTMSGKSPPAYDGIWTGVEVTGFVAGRFAGRERCFVLYHDGEGKNDITELLRSGRNDNNGASPIEWSIETRSLSFNSGGAFSGLKQITGGEVWVSEFSDTLELTMQFRPDQYPCWSAWDTKTICVSSECDEDSACDSLSAGYQLGYKTRIGFGKPPETGNTSDERSMFTAFSFQIRLSGVGYAQISRLIATANIEEEWAVEPPSDPRSVCNAISCCLPSPYSYLATCPPIPRLIVYPYVDVGASVEIIVAWPFIPGASYRLFGRTAVDGEIKLNEYPPDPVDPDWVDPDGWYISDPVSLAAAFPSLAGGDTVYLWLRAQHCGSVLYSNVVEFRYPIV